MEKIIAASSNKHKIKEIQSIMGKFGMEVISKNEAGIPDFDVEEDGDTFEANSHKKAFEMMKLFGKTTIADDSGLMVDYLGGAPGVHSARFSGGGDEGNNRLLIEKLKGLPKEKRTASFVSSVVCIFPELNKEIVTLGKTEGYITEEAHGTNGFGYDPYFYYQPLEKTFAQLSSDEKNAISHRGKAMREFAEKLEGFIKEHGLT